MKKFETIILGGGASGAMCAMVCNGKDIALIDNNTKLAKKLLVTGNGKCNLTNVNLDNHNCLDFYNQNIKKYLNKFTAKETMDYFRNLGLETYCDEQGRVYPISNSAKSVQDVINRQIKNNNINVFLENTVLNIKKEDQTFFVQTDKETFSCHNLVFCLGGNKTDFLLPLEVTVNKNVPSLCALKTRQTKYLNGQRLENVLVKAINHKTGVIKSEMGEILFKEEGLSGIVIFNLSSCFSRSKDFNGELQIDLLPLINEDDLYEMLFERRKLNMPVSEFFVGMFINPIAYEIFEKCNTNENKTSDNLTKEEIKQFVKVIKCLTFEVKGHYNNNQVFSGGVCLCDLDENLMSKNVPNLYICGEACDVDGVCGGYNLQWAWTSGYIVGRNL